MTGPQQRTHARLWRLGRIPPQLSRRSKGRRHRPREVQTISHRNCVRTNYTGACADGSRLTRHSGKTSRTVRSNTKTVRIERGVGGGSSSFLNFAVGKSRVMPSTSPDLASNVVRDVTSCSKGPEFVSDAKRKALGSNRVHVPEPSLRMSHNPNFSPPLRGRGRTAFATHHVEHF